MMTTDAMTSSPQMGEPVPLCPHCLKPVGTLDHFCPRCNGPITAHATTDPLGQVHAMGHAFINAATGEPRGIAVLGMWLIFGPPLLISGPILLGAVPNLIVAWANINEKQSNHLHPVLAHALLDTSVGLALMALCLYAWILWKVTRNYLKHR